MMSKAIRYLNVMRYNGLTLEQLRAIRAGCKRFGFEYARWGFGHNILVRDLMDETGQTNIKVGYVEDQMLLSSLFFEVYNLEGFPVGIRTGVEVIMAEVNK